MSTPTPDMDRLEAARQALAEAEALARSGDAVGLGPRSMDQPPHEPSVEGRADGRSVGRGVGARGRGQAQRGASALSPEGHIRKIVLRQLAMGPRTRAQLETKLRERDCDPQLSRQVLDRMSEVGLVDDEAYAEMYVRSKQESKGLAASALRHELRSKGVAEDTIDAALEEVDPETEKVQARELVRRRLRTMRGLDLEVQTRRLAGFLARKGYGSGISYQVIREALDDLPEHARD